MSASSNSDVSSSAGAAGAAEHTGDAVSHVPEPALAKVLEALGRAASATGAGVLKLGQVLGQGVVLTGQHLYRQRYPLAVMGVAVACAWGLVKYPPMTTVGDHEMAWRSNRWSGDGELFDRGVVMVIPGIHELRRVSLQDHVYRLGDGEAVQSIEGLSLGLSLHLRWTVNKSQLSQHLKQWPSNIEEELVAPAVRGVLYGLVARYTIKDIFSTKRQEILQELQAQLKPRLVEQGLVLREVQLGKIELPADYRRGMEKLLADELASEGMRYTLELKEKAVKESELTAEAEKVRREKEAEAAAREQVIAAKAQEEAMRHVLPFKQKQIEQRQLEAEAEKVARIRQAEGNAQARRIESQGEADSRQKLADAEAYRMNKVGLAQADQMAREGALISRHPLLIQKTMADKLSDKVQVIIAPPPSNGDFLGATLLGGMQKTQLQSGSVADPNASLNPNANPNAVTEQ